MTKQNLQILRILENKQFLTSYSDIELHIANINNRLPFGFKMENTEINMCNLSTLNNYSIKTLYGFWEMEVKIYIASLKDYEYEPQL